MPDAVVCDQITSVILLDMALIEEQQARVGEPSGWSPTSRRLAIEMLASDLQSIELDDLTGCFNVPERTIANLVRTLNALFEGGGGAEVTDSEGVVHFPPEVPVGRGDLRSLEQQLYAVLRGKK